MDDDENTPLLESSSSIDNTPVYPDVTHFIDAPLTYDALVGPDLTYSLVKPLVDKYHAIQRGGNKAVVFCLLLNRAHFLRDSAISSTAVSRSRATLCELLAIRLLSEWETILDLAAVTTIAWPVFNGADPEVIDKADQYGDGSLQQERVGNAIEMAIIGKAKRFIKSSACQKVIDHIWSGKCVYTAESTHSIISDTYKRNPIRMYDPHKAPLLDHYRLKVPAVRSVLEYCTFLILFVLFVVVLENNELERLTVPEIIFMVYGFGFSLEKLATMQEHGLRVYVNGTWNGFDLAFVTIYITYLSLRLHGVYNHHAWAREAGLDTLALAAVLIFPRLAFVTLSNNLLVLSLRSMFVEFFNLMFIAAFIFAGFLYALWTLSRNTTRESYDAGQITWWMLDLWFGLDATGFQLSTTFHPIFGPILFVVYAALSNTLLLTVLVSILSHTFSTISADAEAEAMFRRAVSTIEGFVLPARRVLDPDPELLTSFQRERLLLVLMRQAIRVFTSTSTADALFSYLPPINIIALVMFLPLSYILSPRWFHKVNVAFIRISNLPILLFIAFYERQSTDMNSTTFYETLTTTAERVYDTLPRRIKRMTLFEGLVGGGPDIDAVFEIEEELESEEGMRQSQFLSPSQIQIQQNEADGDTATSKLQQPFFTDSSAATTSASTPAPADALQTPTAALPTAAAFPRSPSPPPSSEPTSSPGRDHLHLGQLPTPGVNDIITPPRPRRRSRLYSQMSRPDVTIGPPVPSSPLTQIYQPLVVDLEEDIPEDSALPPGPLPPARRRLSMHRRNATEPMGSLPIPRRPTALGGLSGSRPTSDVVPEDAAPSSSIPFSESPMRGEARPEEQGHTREEDAGSGDVAARLNAIEERQARIEDLLQRLVALQGR
ncbi:hypothetical protein EXIGLDRAFT_766972 [Exidia glandulosa HHB12029]|uniref:Ion transport domain-containing protein n=1 Tax=Exidia glandulosa HHB12029 TaxID=1314781 RepID=A0A165JA72_EXIGL|nr:hypothetical protein EXIGLDRAFT_766972 [Exidia glandulosa HHB12029]